MHLPDLSTGSGSSRAITILLALAALEITNAQSPTLEYVLEKAAEYVIAYEQQLGSMIAEEEYVQEVFVQTAGTPLPRFGAPPVARASRRRTLSDFLLIRLGASDMWLGFRDVFEADGRSVREHVDRFSQVLGSERENAVASWRRLANESARFNVGGAYRNFNIPTFALLLLRKEHQPRVKFTKQRQVSIDGSDVWIIAFREVERPSLVVDAANEPAFATGRIWLHPTTGCLVRSEMIVSGPPGSETRSEVQFRNDQRLGAWVPVEMRELYTSRSSTTKATARYSNFRRFEVTVKLINPPGSD